MENFKNIVGKTSLKVRVRTAINVLRNRPVIFRVGITKGNVYTEDTIYPQHFSLILNRLHLVDSDGIPIPVPEDSWVPLEDFCNKKDCECHN